MNIFKNRSLTFLHINNHNARCVSTCVNIFVSGILQTVHSNGNISVLKCHFIYLFLQIGHDDPKWL